MCVVVVCYVMVSYRCVVVVYTSDKEVTVTNYQELARLKSDFIVMLIGIRGITQNSFLRCDRKIFF